MPLASIAMRRVCRLFRTKTYPGPDFRAFFVADIQRAHEVPTKEDETCHSISNANFTA